MKPEPCGTEWHLHASLMQIKAEQRILEFFSFFFYIIGIFVTLSVLYYIIVKFRSYIIGAILLHYRAILLHYQLVVTLYR